jgi:hypothetical protein
LTPSGTMREPVFYRIKIEEWDFLIYLFKQMRVYAKIFVLLRN